MAHYVAKHSVRAHGCNAVGCARGRTPRRGKKFAAVLACALVLALAVPFFAQAWNDLQKPSYTWYTSGATGTQDNPYKLSSVSDYRGFVNIVNGTADVDNNGVNERDSFEGKYVELTSDISLNTAGQSNVVELIGSTQTNTSFNGTFNGNNHTIDNFMVTVAQGSPATNVGLFGVCGPQSTIKNVVVGKYAQLSIEKASTDVQPIKNVGLLVGYTEGSIEGCTNYGSVSITSNVNQTKDVKYTVLNVGGLAGQCLGSVTDCTNKGEVQVYGNGTPRSLTEEEIAANERQESIIVMNTGGVVGCHGALDHTIDADSGSAHGVVSGCTNEGKISLNTPAENGVDRFNSPVYAESANTGGVVGYSRGSVESCTNSGYIRAEKGTYAAGVVGNIRAVAATVSAGSSNYYYDDGMLGVVTSETAGIDSYDEQASLEQTIHVRDCHNSGDVMGNSSPAGVVGAAGTYTEIEGCTNAAGTIVMGTRWNKPFASGIVASTRGSVMYCANFGTVLSGSWNNESQRTYTLQDGYYVSGIAGNTRSYETKQYKRTSPVSEVFGCYNAGNILAGDNMRQRGIVGDNSGNVYNNLLLENTVYNNRIAYGLYEGDDEASGGSFSNNYVLSANLLTSNTWFSFVSSDEYRVEADSAGTMNTLTVLNGAGDRSGWNTYWVSDTNNKNNGYPVLNTQCESSQISLAGAKVELKENAAYTSVVGSVPRAQVTLNGKQLVQGVDFRVVPDETAIEITTNAQDPTPYTATIVGLGNYVGTATQTLKYGISAGDISTCTASVETQRFNWEAHGVTSADVVLTSLAGSRISPEEYTVSFDQNDADLSEDEQTGEKQAINAGKYTLIIAAAGNSEHYTGTTTAELTVQAASILYSLSEEERGKNALPTKISYAGNTYDWESTIYLSSKDPSEQVPANTFEYTGHPIDPQVVSVTYLGRELVEGRDYRVMYGDQELLESGKVIEAGTENVGVKGGTGYGYVMVKNIPGGNFTNYDVMKFTIADTNAKVSLEGAQVRGGGSVIYEGNKAYEPITLWYENQQLTVGVDYTITYANNTQLGTASYAITACADGPFSGTIEGTFDIVEGDAYTIYYTYNDETMTATATGVSYAGISSSYDLVIPSETKFAGGTYTKITYANNAYTTETATAAAGTYTVTAIGNFAFGGGGTRGSSAVWVGSDFALSKVGIESVTIPHTVETIGAYAFAGGSAYDNARLLSSVTFSNIAQSRLTTISEGAFQACGNLTEFTFPANVATIEKAAFKVGTNTTPSNIKKLTFLTHDPTLPSNISTAYAFGGVGGVDKTATVNVYGYKEALAVQALAQENANTASYGTHKGMRFSFTELPSEERDWSVATQEYVSGSGKYLVTHKALSEGGTCTLNGNAMYWNGKQFVTLVTREQARAITNDSFAVKTGTPTSITSGDANENGQINVVDAQIAYDVVRGVYSNFSVLPLTGWLACDYNGDAVVDAADAFAIQRWALNHV